MTGRVAAGLATVVACWLILWTPSVECSQPVPVPDTWEQLAAEHAQVIAMPDPALRNLRITWMYYKINRKYVEWMNIADPLHPGQPDWMITWPGLASYASNSVGVSIRKQTFGAWIHQAFDKVLPASTIAWMESVADLITQLPWVKPMLQQMSDGLGRGNLDVYIEVGGAFLQLAQFFQHDTHQNSTRWALFATQFNYGRQHTLLAGLEHLYRATLPPAPGQPRMTRVDRIQHLALSNFNIGLAEQTLLEVPIYQSFPDPFNVSVFGFNVTVDPPTLATQIVIALQFPNETFFAGKDLPSRAGMHSARYYDDNARYHGGMHNPLLGGERGLFDLDSVGGWNDMLHKVAGSLRSREVQSSSLHRSVPVRAEPAYPPSELWVPELISLNMPESRFLYQTLVVGAGSGWNTTQHTAATDWRSLKQRMRFITPLFRARMDDRSLQCTPFSPANLKQMYAGVLPAEKDLCLMDCCAPA